MVSYLKLCQLDIKRGKNNQTYRIVVFEVKTNEGVLIHTEKTTFIQWMRGFIVCYQQSKKVVHCQHRR